MYNRYIPQPDGSYQRRRLQEPVRTEPPKAPPADLPPACEQPIPAPPPPLKKPVPRRNDRCPRSRQESKNCNSEGSHFLKNLLPKDLDTGDLLIILLLLLMAGDCAEEQNTAILTLALYLFL